MYVCVCGHLFLYLHVCVFFLCMLLCVCVCVHPTGCSVDALIPLGQLVAAPPLSKWSSAFVYVCSKALPTLCGEVCVGGGGGS